MFKKSLSMYFFHVRDVQFFHFLKIDIELKKCTRDCATHSGLKKKIRFLPLMELFFSVLDDGQVKEN